MTLPGAAGRETLARRGGAAAEQHRGDEDPQSRGYEREEAHGRAPAKAIADSRPASP